MSRLSEAYAAHDKAIRELVAASEESRGTNQEWTVSHYVTVIGQQRFTEDGVIESDSSLYTPHGGPLTYSLKGLILEIDELVDISEHVYEVGGDEF